MPVILDLPTCEQVELGDVVEFLLDERIDTSCTQSLQQAAPLLKKLANNRAFLTELALTELEAFCAHQEGVNGYSAQVIMLAPPTATSNFFIRANFWPSKRDAVFRSTGPDPFSYEYPHDHNFNFLTVGYFGPGYWSNYYEYDYSQAIGLPGERAPLQFVEKAQLSEGKVMLYRAFKDIHEQLPADSMSISLNICERSLRGCLMDQYAFDLQSGRISGTINRHSATSLMPVAAHLGGPEAEALLLEIYRKHPSERVRFLALRAAAGAASGRTEEQRLLETGAADISPLVAGLCRERLDRLQADTLFAPPPATSQQISAAPVA